MDKPSQAKERIALAATLLELPLCGAAPDEATLRAHGFELLKHDYHIVPGVKAMLKRYVTDRDHSGSYRVQLVRKHEGDGFHYVLMLGSTQTGGIRPGTQKWDEMLMSIFTTTRLIPTPPQLAPLGKFYQEARQRIAEDMRAMTPQERTHVKLTVFGHSIGGFLAGGLSAGNFDVNIREKDGTQRDYHVQEDLITSEAPGLAPLLKSLKRTPQEKQELVDRTLEILIKLGPHESTYATAVGEHLGGTIALIDLSRQAALPEGLSLRKGLSHTYSSLFSNSFHKREVVAGGLKSGNYVLCDPAALYDKFQFPHSGWQELESAGRQFAHVTSTNLCRTAHIGSLGAKLPAPLVPEITLETPPAALRK